MGIHRGRRQVAAIVAGATIVLGVIAGAGIAAAVSTGGYNPGRQDCPLDADANTFKGADPGCHNVKVAVSDGQGHRYAQVGTDQEAQGDNVHAADASVTPDGRSGHGAPEASAHVDTHWQPIPKGQCGAEDIALYPLEILLYEAGQSSKPCTLDPTKWQAPGGAPTVSPTVAIGSPDGTAVGLLTGADLYVAGDDNADSGEHDGVNGKDHTSKSHNGPSDGGSVEVRWHPLDATGWPGAIEAALAGHPAALASNPVPVADAGGGACADGICAGAYTSQRTVYQGGGGSGKQRDVYDYQGKSYGPYDCNSGDPKSQKNCSDPSKGGNPNGMDGYRQKEAKSVTVEPGVQVYADPDPQSSPVLPNQLYPLPAVYVGTCGVVVGGGGVQAPASPVTNNAGQIDINPTGC